MKIFPSDIIYSRRIRFEAATFILLSVVIMSLYPKSLLTLIILGAAYILFPLVFDTKMSVRIFLIAFILIVARQAKLPTFPGTNGFINIVAMMLPVVLISFGISFFIYGYKKYFSSLTLLDKASYVFILCLVFAAINGLPNNHLMNALYFDIVCASMFLMFPIFTINFVETDKPLNEIEYFFKLLRLFLVLYVINYLLRLYFGVVVVEQRMLGTHLDLMLLFFLIIIQDNFFTNVKKSWIDIIFLIVIIVLSIQSRLRGLWITMIISTSILFVVNLFQQDKGERLRFFWNIIKKIGIIGLSSGMILAVIFRKQIILMFLLAQRLETFTKIFYDAALGIRFIEAMEVIHILKQKGFLLGGGLGQYFITMHSGAGVFVDNSFADVAAKTGLLGLAAFLFMWIIFLVYSFKLLGKLKYIGDRHLKNILIVIPAFAVAEFAMAAEQAILWGYTAGLICSFLMAIVSFSWRKVKNSEKNIRFRAHA